MDKEIQKTILLVEDDVIISMLEVKTISSFGYNVVAAFNGAKAVEKALAEDSISLVLMDIDLGEGIDGTEAARMILSKRNIPIVFLTSHSEKVLVDKIYGITRYGYVIKNSGDFVLQSSIEMAYELFDAHQKTFESERKFRSYIEYSPHGIFVTDEKGAYVEVNEAACKMTGYSNDELLSMNLSELIPDEDKQKAEAHFNEVVFNGKSSGDLTYTKKDGSVKFWVVDAVKLSDTRYLGFVTDITALKQKESALHKNQMQLNTAVDIANLAPWEYDVFKDEFQFNDQFYKIFRTNVEKVGSYTISSSEYMHRFVHPDDQHMVVSEITKAMSAKDQNYVRNLEHKILYDDGQTGIISVSFYVIVDGNGKVIRTYGVNQDITASRKYQDSIISAKKKYSEESDILNQIIDLNPYPVQIIDSQGYVLKTNAAHKEMFGSIPPPAYNFFEDPVFNNDYLSGYPEKLLKAEVVHFPVFSYNAHTLYPELPDKPVWLKMTGFPVFNSADSIEKIVLLFEDITERENALKSLQLSEWRYRSTIATAPIGISGFNDNGKIEFINEKFIKIFGYTLDDFSCIDEWYVLAYPDPEYRKKIQDEWNDGIQKILNNEYSVSRGEYLVFCKDGKTRNVEIFLTKNGNSWLATFNDLTERKKTEEALQTERNLINAIFNSVPGLIYLYNDLGQLIKWNRKHVDMTGYCPEELENMKLLDWYKGDEKSQKAVLDGVDQTLKNGFGEAEAVLQKKDGSVLPMYFTAVPLTIDGKVYFTGIGIDTSEWKSTQEKLKKSENNLRVITENFPDTILQIDRQGHITYINKLVPGLSYEQVIGSNVYKWVPEKQHDIIRHGLEMAFNEEKQFEYESEGPGPNGSWKSYFIRLMPVVIDNKVDSAVYLATDISERKKAEETIKNLLHEKELLLKEVHHRIKNNMHTIINLLALQSETSSDPVVIDVLKDAKSRVLSMLVLYDKLYRSDIFDKVSLADYLSPLVDEIVKNFHGFENITIEKNIDDCFMDSKPLSSLGIITNELITNTMKYAFAPGEKGTIKISANILQNEITLIIEDNGKGIPESVSLESSTGFGLRLVRLLTMQLKGKAQLERENGAKFILKFKI